ncbi:MAG TPA: metal-dependent hydrolase [Planctomycetaceae bacterium]|nr:metal-dependent hydrolase [Planctomycetaceae bacterium]
MIVDTNVYLERWPFRRLAYDQLPKLVEKLAAGGVGQAWVGSFEGLVHEDIDGVNRRLAEACRACRSVQLLPFGSVNPRLPDWREDVRRCHETYRMPGIRLHPNYHGYQLDEPVAGQLFAEAAKRRLIVQLAVRMEDPRTHHPLMQVPDVALEPLVALLQAQRTLPVVLLGTLGTLRGPLLVKLVEAGEVHFEISMLEGAAGIARILRDLPVERLLFGSHMPLFHLESALLKLEESPLSAAQRRAITAAGARRLMGGPRAIEATSAGPPVPGD